MDSLQPKIRLNKFLAERLGVSRREADELITSGKVTVDGTPAILGTKVDSKSNIVYNKHKIPFETEFKYIAFHKPVGYVCSRRSQGSTPTLYDLLPKSFQQLKTVGRLDKDSSGLILLTNNGDFAFRMTHPRFRKTKQYEVVLSKPLAPLHQQMISDYGVMLDDGISQFTVIKKFKDAPSKDHQSKQSSPDQSDGASPAPTYEVLMTEGRNRQIRRTFAALGYKVTKLHRTGFGKYELGDLKPGKYVIIEP